jgi:hypothetical protein
MADKKLAFEFDAFQEFVRITGLVLDIDSIQQDAPPAPDISCSIRGVQCFFELTRVTDVELEQKVMTGRSGPSNFRMGIEELVLAIRNKRSKRYVANGPIDLVVHDGAGAPIDGFWAGGQDDGVTDLMGEEIEGSQFRRIWLVDFSAGKFLVAENPDEHAW